jgi:hypothetical protein
MPSMPDAALERDAPDRGCVEHVLPACRRRGRRGRRRPAVRCWPPRSPGRADRAGTSASEQNPTVMFSQAALSSSTMLNPTRRPTPAFEIVSSTSASGSPNGIPRITGCSEPASTKRGSATSRNVRAASRPALRTASTNAAAASSPAASSASSPRVLAGAGGCDRRRRRTQRPARPAAPRPTGRREQWDAPTSSAGSSATSRSISRSPVISRSSLGIDPSVGVGIEHGDRERTSAAARTVLLERGRREVERLAEVGVAGLQRVVAQRHDEGAQRQGHAVGQPRGVEHGGQLRLASGRITTEKTLSVGGLTSANCNAGAAGSSNDSRMPVSPMPKP